MRVRVDYAPCKVGSATYFRPYLDVVLRCGHGNQESFPIDVLLDTGSDLCLFDWAIAHTMGFDPRAVGVRSSLSGLGDAKQQETRVVPVTIYVERSRRSFDIPAAEFCQIPKNLGVAGVLGHRGFLDQLSVTFAFGEYFEIVVVSR